MQDQASESLVYSVLTFSSEFITRKVPCFCDLFFKAQDLFAKTRVACVSSGTAQSESRP